MYVQKTFPCIKNFKEKFIRLEQKEAYSTVWEIKNDTNNIDSSNNNYNSNINI